MDHRAHHRRGHTRGAPPKWILAHPPSHDKSDFTTTTGFKLLETLRINPE
jgi:hypothetical protein